ncbi:MAG: PKD domain-containing protein [Solirubrobacterales bacterium]
MHGRRIAPATLIAALTLFVIPAVASATDYCVGSSPLCPVQTQTPDATGIGQAITQANGTIGTDRIFLAAGTYNISTGISVTVTDHVDVIGEGTDKTIIEDTVSNQAPLGITFADSTSSISGIRVNIDPGATNPYGLVIGKGIARNFKIVDQLAAPTNLRGASLYTGATLADSSIELNSSGSSGVVMQSGSSTVTNSKVIGSDNGTQWGINVSTSGTASIDHSELRGLSKGIYMDGGTTNVSDSLFVMNAANNLAMDFLNPNNGALPVNSTIKRVTVIGKANNQTALYTGADFSTESANSSVSDSLFYGTGASFTAIDCVQANSGTVVLSSDHNAFKPGELATSGTCAPAVTNTVDITSTAPKFIDPAAGNYRPAFDSPVVDAGTDGALLPNGAVDLAGGARVVDGNGDGTTAVDPGAYEYQRTPPVVSATATPTTAAPGDVVKFSGSASDAESEAITLAWMFDDGASVAGGDATHTFATIGTHTATLTATDAAGVKSTAALSIVVVAPSAKVSAKPKKPFKRGSKGFATTKSKKQPSFAVTFANAAKAKFTIAKVKGSQTLSVASGKNYFKFGGKLARKKLKAGSYKLTITPLSVRNTAGTPVTLKFKLK